MQPQPPRLLNPSGIAVIILVLMGLLAYGAAWNDAMIVDEDPHIGAGISYVTERDMRLNPEHPPLVKWFAALPLVLIDDLAVPLDHPSWTEPRTPAMDGQWAFGRAFIFESGNDADVIIRLVRIGPTLLMLLLGWFLFRWTHERAGRAAGLLALLLYATAPAILGHGVLVTTDVPAALGSFGATYFFLRFLHVPSRKNLLTAGIAFGLAQLLKFSVVLLIPYFGIVAVGWWVLERTAGSVRASKASSGEDKRAPADVPKRYGVMALWRYGSVRYIGGTVVVGIIGLVVIYLFYAAFAISGYPYERQLEDTIAIASQFPNQAAGDFVVRLTQVPGMRPLAQYLLGLFMVVQRAVGGNTTFFMGQVAREAWLSYFPLVYLFKERLAVHVMTIIALAVGGASALYAIRNKAAGSFFHRIADWKVRHFDELAMLFFIFVYWFSSMTSNLNIGMRHLSPSFPFVLALVAIGVRRFLSMRRERLSFATVSRTMQRTVLVLLLVAWAVIAGLTAFPHYLPYYNELAAIRGGGENIAVDSNFDWGQDLKRLAEFVEEREIEAITINYFGWAPPEYYMPNVAISGWWADWEGRPEGWFAVSASFRQQACATPVKGFGDQAGDDYDGYCWLNDFEPEAVIGKSIYVYHLPAIVE